MVNNRSAGIILSCFFATFFLSYGEDKNPLLSSLVAVPYKSIQLVHCEWQVDQTLYIPNPCLNTIHYVVNIAGPTKYIIEQDFNGPIHYEYRADGAKVFTICSQRRTVAIANDPENVLLTLLNGLPPLYLKKTFSFNRLPPTEVMHTGNEMIFQWMNGTSILKIVYSEAEQSLDRISFVDGNASLIDYKSSEAKQLNGLIPVETWVDERKSNNSPQLKQHWKLLNALYDPNISNMDFGYKLEKGYNLDYVAGEKSFQINTDDIFLRK